jgi:hypothetical protein
MFSAQSPEFTEVGGGGLHIKYRNTAGSLQYLNTSLFRILPIPSINLKTESSIPPAFKGPPQCKTVSYEDDRNLNLWKVVILILQYPNDDSPRNDHVELIMIP